MTLTCYNAYEHGSRHRRTFMESYIKSEISDSAYPSDWTSLAALLSKMEDQIFALSQGGDPTL